MSEYWMPVEGSGADVGKDDRRLYTCPQCDGAQVITKWKRADLTDDPEVQEIQTTELCPTCDGSGQILGPST
jgi:DnaJ-class molecular chaperone